MEQSCDVSSHSPSLHISQPLSGIREDGSATTSSGITQAGGTFLPKANFISIGTDVFFSNTQPKNGQEERKKKGQMGRIEKKTKIVSLSPSHQYYITV